MAQQRTLEETLEILSADAAKKYLSPISSALGSDLNGGWFHRAPEATKIGFDLEIGFVVMGSFFPTEAQHFLTEGTFVFSDQEARFLLNQAGVNPGSVQGQQLLGILTDPNNPSAVQISGATIIGSSTDSIIVKMLTGQLGGQAVKLPVAGFGDLADVNVLPLAAPQFSIGTFWGTQATFRWLPSVELSADLGKFSYFGFGLQHNPGIWFGDPLPIDLAVGFYTQNLEIGTLFTTKTTAFGINASKRLGWGALNLTPYAGFLIENSDMQVAYDYVIRDSNGLPISTQNITFELEAENKSRFTIGLSLKLLLFNLNADYNFGKYNSFTAGLNFII